METTPCRHCQTPIEFEPITGIPFTLRPTVCGACEQRFRSEAASSARRTRYEAFQRLAPPIYRDTDPNHPSMPPREKLTQILAWQPGPRGLGLTINGPTRCGKTRSVWLLIKRLMVEDKLLVTAMNSVAFANQSALAHSTSAEAAADWKWELSTVAVLFLDDLGKEKLTDRSESDLWDVIETRTSFRLPLLITSNYDGKTLVASKFSPDRGPAIVARIREFTLNITV